MKNQILLKGRIKEGKLELDQDVKNKLVDFCKKTESGNVELYISVSDGSGTLGQLSRIHAMIRQIAIETGSPFTDIKNIVKERSGFENVSLGDNLDYKDLDFIIKQIYELGDFVGVNLR